MCKDNTYSPLQRMNVECTFILQKGRIFSTIFGPNFGAFFGHVGSTPWARELYEVLGRVPFYMTLGFMYAMIFKVTPDRTNFFFFFNIFDNNCDWWFKSESLDLIRIWVFSKTRFDQNTRIRPKYPDPTKIPGSNQNTRIRPKYPDPTKKTGSNQDARIRPKYPTPTEISRSD